MLLKFTNIIEFGTIFFVVDQTLTCCALITADTVIIIIFRWFKDSMFFRISVARSEDELKNFRRVGDVMI